MYGGDYVEGTKYEKDASEKNRFEGDYRWKNTYGKGARQNLERNFDDTQMQSDDSKVRYGLVLEDSWGGGDASLKEQQGLSDQTFFHVRKCGISEPRSVLVFPVPKLSSERFSHMRLFIFTFC